LGKMKKAMQQSIAISGGSRGIGRAVAEKFAAHGFTIAVAARGSEELVQLQAYWRLHFPQSRLLVWAADLSTEAGVATFADGIGEALGSSGLLLHNVGSFAVGGIDEAGDPLAALLALNVLAADRLTRRLLPGMRQAGSGHIMTIGSVAVLDMPVGVENYTISKYALQAWHHTLERQLAGTPIRTTLLQPGATYTSSWEGEEVDPAHLLSPRQVAEAVWQAWQAGGSLRELVLRPTL
jgi:short-subunit dehydrogenase